MKFSVIVPAYIKNEQAKAYLKECLDSIKAQSFSDYEVIVVDDASPVEIKQLVDSYGFRYFRMESNSGIGAVRKKGTELATGDYITFLSHDDKWHPDFLKVMSEHAGSSILYSNYYNIDEKGNIMSMFKAPSFEEKETKLAIWAWARRNDTFINLDTAVIPKTVFEKVQIDPNLRIGEDLKFYLQACKWFRFDYVDVCLVYYRRHPEQETLFHLAEIAANNKKILEEVEKWWKEE